MLPAPTQTAGTAQPGIVSHGPGTIRAMGSSWHYAAMLVGTKSGMMPSNRLRAHFFELVHGTDQLTVQTFPAWRTWAGWEELAWPVVCLVGLRVAGYVDLG